MAEAVKKDSYHHGDLREALIQSAYDIISEAGPSHFSMADACRRAGVSAAAPYRHFDGREELLAEVVYRGLQNLDEYGRQQRDKFPLGTIESIISLGNAYVDFAISNPRIFKLIFAKTDACERRLEKLSDFAPIGFNKLTEVVEAFLEQNGLTSWDVLEVALPLWSLVHGIASLQIDGDFDSVAPGTDVKKLVENSTRGFLGGLLGEQYLG